MQSWARPILHSLHGTICTSNRGFARFIDAPLFLVLAPNRPTRGRAGAGAGDKFTLCIVSAVGRIGLASDFESFSEKTTYRGGFASYGAIQMVDCFTTHRFYQCPLPCRASSYKPRADARMRPDGPTRFVKRLPSLKIYLIYRPFCQLHIRPVVLAPEPWFGGNIINLHPQYTSFCLTYVKSLDELYKEECVCSPYSSRLRDMFPAFWLTHL